MSEDLRAEFTTSHTTNLLSSSLKAINLTDNEKGEVNQIFNNIKLSQKENIDKDFFVVVYRIIKNNGWQYSDNILKTHIDELTSNIDMNIVKKTSKILKEKTTEEIVIKLAWTYLMLIKLSK